MKNFIKSILLSLTFLVLVTACGQVETQVSPGDLVTPTPEEPRTLRVMTHDSFAYSEETLAIFETQNNVVVQFILAGDTGTAVNKAVLSKGAPIADVFYGVDNTFLSRALTEGIFEPYDSLSLANIPSEFKLDPENRALPVDYGDVCLNYEKAYFENHNLAVPTSFDDLLDPAYKSLLVVENPAISSPGLAFLLATIGHYGPENYLDFWQGLVNNDVLVVNDWETAYRSEFSQYGGTRPIVVSYGSSPPFEVIYAQSPIDEPPTGVIAAKNTCFRQIEFVGILKGTENRDLAEKWVDFMLSPAFQIDLPLQMFVFPINPETVLDDAFVKYLAVPEQPVILSPEEIAANRDNWIQAWTETVLH